MYQFMLLNGLSFNFYRDKNNICRLYVENVKGPKRHTIFSTRGNQFLLSESTMSGENKYKSIAIVERNRKSLLEGMREWTNIQKKE